MPYHRPLYFSKPPSRHRKTFNNRLEIVALDCEFVGCGPNGQESVLARATLLDHNGTVLLDEYSKPSQPITDYRTHVSGITAEVLATNVKQSFTVTRNMIARILKKKLLVGHGLENDLRVLQIQHPWYMTRDTACFRPYMKLKHMPVTSQQRYYNNISYEAPDPVWCPRSLKELSQVFLKRRIQVAEHSSREDARAALDLYRLVWRNWDGMMHETVVLAGQQRQQQQQQQQQVQWGGTQQYWQNKRGEMCIPGRQYSDDELSWSPTKVAGSCAAALVTPTRPYYGYHAYP